jgi:hypothetical protein
MRDELVRVFSNNVVWVARLGPWKLVIGPRRQVADCRLFNLDQDPDEHRDLAASHPLIVEDLLDRAGASAREITPLALTAIA